MSQLLKKAPMDTHTHTVMKENTTMAMKTTESAMICLTIATTTNIPTKRIVRLLGTCGWKRKKTIKATHVMTKQLIKIPSMTIRLIVKLQAIYGLNQMKMAMATATTTTTMTMMNTTGSLVS